MVGLGAGAGARGLAGLVEMARRNLTKPPKSTPAPVPVDVPFEENKEASTLDFLKGDYAQSVSGVPWAIPAAVGGGVAGLAGGWSLMDYLLDKRRKGDLDAELDTAKRDYESALANNAHHKLAGDATIAKELDELYDEMTKKADQWTDMLGQGAGLYGLYGGVSGLTAAMLAYNWGKKRQRKALIDRALKDRKRRRFASQPSALYVRPDLGPGNAPDMPGSMQSAPPSDQSEGFEL